MKTPRIKDNDVGDITAEIDGHEIRGWLYFHDAERHLHMIMAQEFVEGWYQAVKASAAPDYLEQLKDVADFLDDLQRIKPKVHESPDGDCAVVIDADIWGAFEDDAAKLHAQLMTRIRNLEGGDA